MDARNPPTTDDKAQKLAQWWGRNKSLFTAALADLPIDLVNKACALTMQRCRFIPSAADIRQYAEVDMVERHDVRRRLFTARIEATRSRSTDRPSYERTPEQLAAADALMAKLRASLTETADRMKL